MSGTLQHGRVAFAIDGTDILSRDTEGNPFCTLLMEISLDDGRHWRAKVPDNHIKPMFDAVRKLVVERESLMHLGLDVPMMDLYLRLDPENRILVTAHPFPETIATLNIMTRPDSEGLHSAMSKISAMQDIAGETGDIRALAEVALKKLLERISYDDRAGSLLRASLMLEIDDVQFWTRPRELLDSMLSLLRDVAQQRPEPTTGTPPFVRDAENYLVPLGKIANQDG